MGSLKLTTASSGSVILSPANTASDVTITVPAVTGTMITTASTFAGTGPAFSATPSVNQTLTATTFTKILFQTAEFDTTSGMYASSRFTPTVAGYYQISSGINWGATISRGIIKIYKNGTSWKILQDLQNSTSNTSSGSALVYCNGSTDYIEIYAWAGVGCTLTASGEATWFQASMVRSA